MLIPDYSYEDFSKAQRNLALKAMNNARNKDTAFSTERGTFSQNYKIDLINTLKPKPRTVEQKLSISITNAKHALHEMLYKIHVYKSNLDLQEGIGEIPLVDAIMLRNEMNECENEIEEKLELLTEMHLIHTTSQEQRNALIQTYQTSIESIEIMLAAIVFKYEEIMENAKRLLPLS